MAILGIVHVQLAIPAGGEEKARGFFGDLLGMQEVPKPATLSVSGCWFEGGSLNLHLGVDPDFRAATKAHPALLVDDLAELRKRLDQAGVKISNGKQIEGYRRLFVDDPFGNRIEIMEKI